MELNLKLCRDDGDPLPQLTWYRELVGVFIHLFATLLDIFNTVYIRNWFISAPTTTIIRLFFVYFAIFMESWLNHYFSLQIYLSFFEFTPMLVGPMIPIPIVQPLVFSFFLDPLICFGVASVKTLLPGTTEVKYWAMVDTSIELKWLHDLYVICIFWF